jgi:hypothetical protein
VSAEALNRARTTPSNHHARIHWIEHDMDDGFPRDLRLADLIVVSRYLDLDIVRAAAQQLRTGGYVLCEVHLAMNQGVVAVARLVGRVPWHLRKIS